MDSISQFILFCLTESDDAEYLQMRQAVARQDDEQKSAVFATASSVVLSSFAGEQAKHTVIHSLLQEEHPKIKGYIEDLVPRYSNFQFKSHFRLTRTSVELLCATLVAGGLHVPAPGHGGKTPVSVEKKSLITLWFLANQESFRTMAERFDVCDNTVRLIIKEITGILSSTSVVSKIITWPTRDQVPRVEAEFKAKAGVPGVIGAVDGSHIPVVPPSAHQEDYVNRKQRHSLLLQGCCTSDGRYTNIFAGFPGKVHDARMWSNSALCKGIEENPQRFFPAPSYHLAGDSAYPGSNYLITPYRPSDPEDPGEVYYNTLHSSTRMPIECSYGVLKGRFRILKREIEYEIPFIVDIITTCCVLHNLCIDTDDDPADLPDYIATNGRDLEEMEDLIYQGPENQAGINKRNFIKNLLVSRRRH